MDETVALSDTNITVDGADATMDSSMKLSCYQASSPEYSLYSSASSTGQFSPSPYTSQPSSPHVPASPLSTMDENDSSAPTSPSTMSDDSMSPPVSLRSPSPHNRAVSPPSPSTPDCSYSPMSTTDSHYDAFSPAPINYHVSPPPLYPISPSSTPLNQNPPSSPLHTNSLPTLTPLEPAATSAPAEVAPPRLSAPSPPWRHDFSGFKNRTVEMALRKYQPRPLDQSSPRSLSISPPYPPVCGDYIPSSPIPDKEPFYSLSPKRGCPEPRGRSPFDTFDRPELWGKEWPEHVSKFKSEAPLDLTSRSTTSSQEVVDLIQGQPCVVDLTCEDDDDDVKIVASEQPVVFLSESTSNTSRAKVKKNRQNSDQSPDSTTSEDPVVVIKDSTTSEDPVVVINETTTSTTPLPTTSNNNNNNKGDTPATAIEIMDAPPLRQSTYQPPQRNPPELFGDLLHNQSVTLLGFESNPSNPPTGSGSSGGGYPWSVGISLHRNGQQRSSNKASGSGSNLDRCRSPLHPVDSGSRVPGHPARNAPHGSRGLQPPDLGSRLLMESTMAPQVLEDLTPLGDEGRGRNRTEGHLGLPTTVAPSYNSSRPPLRSDSGSRPMGHASRSLIEAPIPPDVLEDLASLVEDCPRAQPSVPAIYRQFLLAEELRLIGEQHPKKQQPPAVPPNQLIPTASSHSNRFSSSASHSTLQSTSHSSTASTSRAAPSTTDDEAGGLCCPICFESFQEIKGRGKTLSSTVCGHIFCTECLQASFGQAKQCPTCRKRLNKKQFHPLYI